MGTFIATGTKKAVWHFLEKRIRKLNVKHVATPGGKAMQEGRVAEDVWLAQTLQYDVYVGYWGRTGSSRSWPVRTTGSVALHEDNESEHVTASMWDER